MADTTYQPKVYRKQGGDQLVIASGGSLSFETGSAIQPAPAVLGTDNAKGVFIYSPNSSESFFQNTNNDKRSYLLRVEAYRPSTLPLGRTDHALGVDDAAIYALYRSYAADEPQAVQRALNVSVNHRGTSAGSINGALIGTNVSTSTVVGGDLVTAVMNNENYGVSVAGVSGVLDLTFTHEGANAVGTEFGLRVRNAKKNGSSRGAYIILDDATSTTTLAYGVDMSAAVMGTAEIRLTNGQCIASFSTAITSNSTLTSLPAGSLGVTSNGTGIGKLFVADGTKWQIVTSA